MTPSQQAVIFDWNGTLLADTALAVRATNHVLDFLQVPHISKQDFQNEYTLPIKDFYLRVGCEEKRLTKHLDKTFTMWVNYYEAAVTSLRMRSGARDVLGYLKDNGHKSAILSNASQQVITTNTRRFGIAPLFDQVLANDPDEYIKIMKVALKGERLKNYIKDNDVREAIIVGDSEEEIEIAKKSGHISVAITGGFVSEKRLRAAKPDYLIHSLPDLLPIIQKNFKSRRTR